MSMSTSGWRRRADVEGGNQTLAGSATAPSPRRAPQGRGNPAELVARKHTNHRGRDKCMTRGAHSAACLISASAGMTELANRFSERIDSSSVRSPNAKRQI